MYHIYLADPKPAVLFKEGLDYGTFMIDFTRLIHPIAETYAYCLLPNRFHFFLRFYTLQEQVEGWYFDDKAEVEPFEPLNPQRQWDALMALWEIKNTNWVAKTPVDEVDCGRLVRYIHHQPIKNGLTEELTGWKWSSWQALISKKQTLLARPSLLNWFHSPELMIAAHDEPLDETRIGYLTGI